MTREIRTRTDVAAERLDVVRQLTPPATIEARLGGAVAPDIQREIAKIPPADTWQNRLLNYIPSEAMGVYLALDRAVQGAVNDSRIWWLAGVLFGCILFNYAYLKRIWKVKRDSQIIISSLALVAYVYATGGVFTELGWSTPISQAVVLIATAAVLVFVEPPGPAIAERAN